MVYTLRFFPLQNAVCFIILTCLVPVLFTFHTKDVLKLKKKNFGSKRLNSDHKCRVNKFMHNYKFTGVLCCTSTYITNITRNKIYTPDFSKSTVCFGTSWMPSSGNLSVDNVAL